MKKSVLIVTILLLLSLVVTSTVAAEVDHKLPKWEQVFDPSEYLGEGAFTDSIIEFKGRLYLVAIGAEPENQLWESRDGKHWSLALDAGSMQEGYETIYFGLVFKDQLYATMEDWNGVLPTLIVRTPDGQNWEKVFTAPIVDGYNTGFCGLTSFKGSLYTTICNWSNEIDGVRLWRSTSGNLGSWEEVAKFQGWDTSSSSFETFKGALYVGSEWIISETGETLPAQILRSYDGVNWESVIIAGFGDLTNINVYGLEQKASYLYAGTGSFEGGGDIWRTKDGVNWQPITTDGLGNLNNLAFGFVTYQNLLYTYSVNFDGILVYSSKDGVRWTPASEPGLGDSRNIVIWYERGRVVFKGGLYMSAGAGGVYKLAKP